MKNIFIYLLFTSILFVACNNDDKVLKKCEQEKDEIKKTATQEGYNEGYKIGHEEGIKEGGRLLGEQFYNEGKMK